MASFNELEKSIKEYELQILRIDLAILQTEESESVENLNDLKKNLSELLNLTKHQLLNELQNETPPDEDPMQAEMDLFMKEMKEIDEPQEEDDLSSDDEDSTNQLKVSTSISNLNNNLLQLIILGSH